MLRIKSRWNEICSNFAAYKLDAYQGSLILRPLKWFWTFTMEIKSVRGAQSLLHRFHELLITKSMFDNQIICAINIIRNRSETLFENRVKTSNPGRNNISEVFSCKLTSEEMNFPTGKAFINLFIWCTISECLLLQASKPGRRTASLIKRSHF